MRTITTDTRHSYVVYAPAKGFSSLITINGRMRLISFVDNGRASFGSEIKLCSEFGVLLLAVPEHLASCIPCNALTMSLEWRFEKALLSPGPG
jgi:hypothetical protein